MRKKEVSLQNLVEKNTNHVIGQGALFLVRADNSVQFKFKEVTHSLSSSPCISFYVFLCALIYIIDY